MMENLVELALGVDEKRFEVGVAHLKQDQLGRVVHAGAHHV